MWATPYSNNGLTRPMNQKFGKPVSMPSQPAKKESPTASSPSMSGKETLSLATKGLGTPHQLGTPKSGGLSESKWATTTVSIRPPHAKPLKIPIAASTVKPPTETTPPRCKFSPLAAEFKPSSVKQDEPSATPPEDGPSNPAKAPSVVSMDTESCCSPEIVMPSAKASDELARISSTESNNTPNKDKSPSASGSANTDNTPISPADSSNNADKSSKTTERPMPVTTASPVRSIKNSTDGADPTESSSPTLKETSGNAQLKVNPPTSSLQKPQSVKTAESSMLKVEPNTEEAGKAPETKLGNTTKAQVKPEEPSISSPQKAGWVVPEKRQPRGQRVSPPSSQYKQGVKSVSPVKRQPGYLPPHERHLHSTPKVTTPPGTRVSASNTAVSQTKVSIKSEVEPTKKATNYVPPHERHLQQATKTTENLPPHLRAALQPIEAEVKKPVEEPKKTKKVWSTTLIIKTDDDGVVKEFIEVPRKEEKKKAKPSDSNTSSKTESTQSVANTKSHEGLTTKDEQNTTVAPKVQTRNEAKPFNAGEQKAAFKPEMKPVRVANYVPPHMRQLTAPTQTEAKKPSVTGENKGTIKSEVKSPPKAVNYVPPHMRHLTETSKTEEKKPSITIEDKATIKSDVKPVPKPTDYVAPHMRHLTAPIQSEAEKPSVTVEDKVTVKSDVKSEEPKPNNDVPPFELKKTSEEQKETEGKCQAEEVSQDVEKENCDIAIGEDGLAPAKPTVSETAPVQTAPEPKPEEAQAIDVVTQPITVTSKAQTTDLVKSPIECEAEEKSEVEPAAKTDSIALSSPNDEAPVKQTPSEVNVAKTTPSPEFKAAKPTKSADANIPPHLRGIVDTKSTRSSVSAAVEEPKKTQSEVSNEAKQDNAEPEVEITTEAKATPASELQIVASVQPVQQKLDPETGKVVPPHLWHTLKPASSPSVATEVVDKPTTINEDSAIELQQKQSTDDLPHSAASESAKLTETTTVAAEQKPEVNQSEHKATSDLIPLETHESPSSASAKVTNTTPNTEKEEPLLPPHIRYGMLYEKATPHPPKNTVDTTSKASNKVPTVKSSNSHTAPSPSIKAKSKTKPSITQSTAQKSNKKPTTSHPEVIAHATTPSDEKVEDKPETYVPPHIRYQAGYNPNAQPAQPCNGQVDSNTPKGESGQNGLQTSSTVKKAEADATCTGEEFTDDVVRQEMALVPYVAKSEPEFAICMYGSIGGSQKGDHFVAKQLSAQSKVDSMPKALDIALPAHVSNVPSLPQSSRDPPHAQDKQDGALVKSKKHEHTQQKTPSFYKPGAVWTDYDTGSIRHIADIHQIWTHPMLRQLPIRHVRCLPKTELVQELGRDRDFFRPVSCTMFNLDMSDCDSRASLVPYEAIMPDRFKPSHIDRCLPQMPLADVVAAGSIHDYRKKYGNGYPVPWIVHCDFYKQRKKDYGRLLHDHEMDLSTPGSTIFLVFWDDLRRFCDWADEVVDCALATPILVDKNDPNFLSGVKPVSGTADVCARIPPEVQWLPDLPPNFDEEEWDIEKEKRCRTELDTFREIERARRELVRYQTSASGMEYKVALATQALKEKSRQKEEARVSRQYQLSDPTKLKPHDPYGPPLEKDNPMDPEVDIFLRPARLDEMDQIAERYNEIALRSSDIPDNGYTPKEYFDNILAYCNTNKLPFIVACTQSSRQRNRRRKHMGPQVYREVIVGLAYVKPFRPEACFAGTVELFVIVDRYLRHKGIGQNLMDRILPALDRRYISHCATWFYPEDHDKSEFVDGGSQKVRKIVISVYHEDNDIGATKLAWKTRVLETFGFLPYANFYNIGAYDTGVNGETRGQP